MNDGEFFPEHENQEQLRLLVSAVSKQSDILIITESRPIDHPGPRIVYVNNAFERCTGYTRAEVIGLSPRILQGPRTQREELDRIRKALQAWQPIRSELLNYKKSGEEFWIELDIVPLANASGWITHWVAIERDITLRKQSELELAGSRRALTLLGRCNETLFHSKSEQELLSEICRLAVAVGDFRLAWIGYAEADPRQCLVPKACAGEEHEFLASQCISWSQDSDTAGEPAGAVLRGGNTLVVPDVENGSQFAAWLESAKKHGFRGMVCLPLKDQTCTFGVLELWMPQVRVPLADEVKLLEEVAANLSFGIISLRSQAERRRIEAAVLQVASSVTAVANQQFFLQLATSMADAVDAPAALVARLLPGAPGEACRARTLAVVIDGKPEENFDYRLEGTPCVNLLRQEECIVASQVTEHFPDVALLRVLNAQAYVGRRLADSGGRLIGLLFVIFRRPLATTTLVTSTLQILASRAAAEIERQKVDTLLREQASLLDKAQDAILVHDLDNRLTYWNARAARLYGWNAAEVMGRSVCDRFFADPSSFASAKQLLLQNGEWMGPMTQLNKDGRELVVEARWTLVHDDKGQPRSVLVINSDITERLALEDRLRQSQRLEAVGQLTGGVAHDFNNLLTVILGNAELLKEQLRDNAQLAPLAAMVVTAAQRGAQLTQLLLAFARKRALDPKVVNLNQLVTHMAPLLQRTLGEQVDIDLVCGTGLWQALVDPTLLDNALLNLCLNARDAMPDGGRLSIEIANAELDATYCARHVDVQPGEYVMVEVSDTGNGIPAENLQRVFEPFFTTKALGMGTGLGLAMVYGFVKQSQGHISISSVPAGKGTTASQDKTAKQGTSVKMYLPRATEVPAPVEPDALEHTQGGDETVLLVEDDELVRNYVADQLLALGYTVLQAATGPQALKIIRRRKDIDLLFTDVIMPGGMNGRELAAKARQLRPALNVLLTSGYSENVIALHSHPDPGLQLLRKPYHRAELASFLRLALNA